MIFFSYKAKCAPKKSGASQRLCVPERNLSMPVSSGIRRQKIRRKTVFDSSFRGCFVIILVSDGKLDNLNSYKNRIYNVLSVILNSGIW